jgi:hypothetical protein
MKKYILALAIFALAFPAYAADPDGGEITTTAISNTSILVQITTAPSAVDSVFVCYFRGAETDTTFAAQIDTVTTNKSLNNLDPSVTYTVFLLVRQGAGGPSDISDKDEVTTYGPEIESNPNRTELNHVERVIRATSWRPGSVLETFTLSGSAASDSSGQYLPWKHNSIIVKATQAGDSVKAMLYTWYGRREMTQKGTDTGFASSVDSLNITGQGIFAKTLQSELAAPAMYFKLQTYTGNGKNAAFELYLSRERY